MTSDAALQADELRIERLIAAPPDKIYALWTDPDRLVQWWGPEGYDIPEHALDIRPGGAWRTVMRSPTGSRHAVSGVYREMVPSRRLVFTWGWEDGDGQRGEETEVTVTFEAVPGGTRLVVRQKSFSDQDARDKHLAGWETTLACLIRAAQM